MFELTRKRKIGILMLVDIMIIFLSIALGFEFLRPFVEMPVSFRHTLMGTTIIFYLLGGFVFKVFTRINRFTNLHEIMAIVLATTFTMLANFIVFFTLKDDFSKRLVLLTYVIMTFVIIMSRLIWRLYIEKKNSHKRNQVCQRTILIGAGEGGRILYNSLLGSQKAADIKIVGFVDDDPNKLNIYLSNAKVLGKTADLPKIIKEYQIDMVTIAIPSLSRKKLQKIYKILENTKVKINIMPSMEEIASGKVSMSRFKEIDVVDLLGRDEVKLDIDTIKDKITAKTILVTGAGGSIGSEICRQVMKFNPKELILLGHGENSIYQINKELNNKYLQKNTKLVPLIADVRDRSKMFEMMAVYQPDIVYHAAAHKHVPLMEYNPREAVKNNVFGTKNVAEAAKANNVEHFVMISTDKANNPPNVMGATKRIAEMIVTGLNEKGKTKFSAVRFGNVLGSRGSVIPLFKEQIAKGGPVTVTDFRMTRYFMTIPEASRLVIQSGALAQGGEIFVLDMDQPVKILDLAKNMVRLSGYAEDEIDIVETGIRPGEKLYEELLLDKERNDQQVYEKIFVGNINGYPLEKVMNFVNHLSSDNEMLAKQVVEFANRSNR